MKTYIHILIATIFASIISLSANAQKHIRYNFNGQVTTASFDNLSTLNLHQATSIELLGSGWTNQDVINLKNKMRQGLTGNDTVNTYLNYFNIAGATPSENISTGLEYMFHNFTALDEVIFNNSMVSNEISLKGTFKNASSLTNVRNLQNLHNVTNFEEAFMNCTSLTMLTLGNNQDYHDVSFKRAFYNCVNITSINNLANYRNITDLKQAFYNCQELLNVNLSSSNNDNPIDFTSTFENCYKITGANGLENFSS